MTPEQVAAIAKAEAAMKPAIDLYEHRCQLWRLTCRLPLRDLMRLNFLLAKLSDDDMRQIAAYAEALAEWDDMAHGQSGGTDQDRQAARKAPEERDSRPVG